MKLVKKISIPLLGAGVAAAGVGVLLDKRRRTMAKDRATALVRRGSELVGRKTDYAAGVAKGAAHQVTEPVRGEDREYDDVTLARKVESEIFRPADAPKGQVSVNAHGGIVELRGEVKRPEQVKELGEAAAAVDGVKEVSNLLHTPGSPPKH